jgi:hypothetical protein
MAIGSESNKTRGVIHFEQVTCHGFRHRVEQGSANELGVANGGVGAGREAGGSAGVDHAPNAASPGRGKG